jgi:predicted GIY-YIG superfamily endonuclease
VNKRMARSRLAKQSLARRIRYKNMPYSVYILLNKLRTQTYTGVASDVEERLKEHNDGKVLSSRPYRPYEMIHVETYSTLKEARQKELFYKSTTGRRRLREIISRVSTDVNH